MNFPPRLQRRQDQSVIRKISNFPILIVPPKLLRLTKPVENDLPVQLHADMALQHRQEQVMDPVVVDGATSVGRLVGLKG